MKVLSGYLMVTRWLLCKDRLRSNFTLNDFGVKLIA